MVCLIFKHKTNTSTVRTLRLPVAKVKLLHILTLTTGNLLKYLAWTRPAWVQRDVAM